MDFFGLTYYGPQNYIKDMIHPCYQEPMKEEDVKPLMKKVIENSDCPQGISRPDVETIRVLDVYIGRVDGFAYGSKERFIKMKKKGVIKPCGPCDMYRLPPTTYFEYGWWHCDPALKNATWYKTEPRYPQPCSPNTLILDKARKNSKYASLF